MSQRPPPKSPRAALEPQHMSPMPKYSARARNPWVVAGNALFTLLALVMIGGGVALFYGKQLVDGAGPLPEDRIVNIPAKSGTGDIAETLQRNGVIDVGKWPFIGAVTALNARGELKSGEYAFQKNASLRDVIGTLVNGKVILHSITIPEGLTSEQIVGRLQDADFLDGSPKEMPREGTLLPDTYKFARGTKRDDVVKYMQQSHRKLVAEIWERRNPEVPVRSADQLVTLASIVEKETGKSDERSRVAAVFSNRLRQRIKLQSDPTIIYGLVGGRGTLGRPIKRSEITQPSPFNTYVIEGLPPGPIANPGRASLEATANPARTRDLFFVADGSGGHAFSETYDQHQKGVAKLRAMEKAQQADRVEPDDAPATAPSAVVPAAAAPSAAAPVQARPAPAPSSAPAAAPKAGSPKASTTSGNAAASPAAAADPAVAAARKKSASAPPKPAAAATAAQ